MLFSRTDPVQLLGPMVNVGIIGVINLGVIKVSGIVVNVVPKVGVKGQVKVGIVNIVVLIHILLRALLIFLLLFVNAPLTEIVGFCLPEDRVHRALGPLGAVLDEVGVGPQREPRVGVAQVFAQCLDRLALVQRCAGVEVP